MPHQRAELVHPSQIVGRLEDVVLGAVITPDRMLIEYFVGWIRHAFGPEGDYERHRTLRRCDFREFAV